MTEYYRQLPDGSLLEMKPLPDTEKPLPRPQADVLPAQGLGQYFSNTWVLYYILPS